MQQTLLAKDPLLKDNIETAGVLIPATEMAGDYFDLHEQVRRFSDDQLVDDATAVVVKIH